MREEKEWPEVNIEVNRFKMVNWTILSSNVTRDMCEWGISIITMVISCNLISPFFYSASSSFSIFSQPFALNDGIPLNKDYHEDVVCIFSVHIFIYIPIM